MTITSDWGEWLPRAIADAAPDSVAIWYLGCNGFVLKSSDDTVLFIDPYLGTGDPPRTIRMIPVPFAPRDVAAADAIFATHEHIDHVHGPSQAPIMAETGADFFGPAASVATAEAAGWTDEYEIAADQFTTATVGETYRIGDLTVTVGPANDPDADEPVSYLVAHESGSFFHGGDARPGGFGSIGEDHDIDVGALAFGSRGMVPDKETREPVPTTWYSDENMVVEAANELQLDTLVPTHWDMWKGMTADPTALHDHVRSFPYPRRLEIVEIGDRIDL